MSPDAIAFGALIVGLMFGALLWEGFITDRLRRRLRASERDNPEPTIIDVARDPRTGIWL